MAQRNTQELRQQLVQCFQLIYGEEFAHSAATLYFASEEDTKIYSVGCLLLTLTASVNPQYSLVDSRLRTLGQAFFTSQEVDELSKAGLFLQDDGSEQRLVCFHCNAKVRLPVRDGWDAHRRASPNCYFVRFRDFLAAGGWTPQAEPALQRDVDRYIRALRKLSDDLESSVVDFAASFGYERRQLDFACTRHFMRNGGRVPDRPGDCIRELHACQSAFSPAVLAVVNVRLLLQLKLFDAGQQSLVIGRYDRALGRGRGTPVTQQQLQAMLGARLGRPAGQSGEASGGH